MPMPKPVCRTSLNNEWVQYEVCRTSLGRGMGMNITAHFVCFFSVARAHRACVEPSLILIVLLLLSSLRMIMIMCMLMLMLVIAIVISSTTTINTVNRITRLILLVL